MRTFIIHVSNAYAREKHMQEQVKGKDLEVTYILDGDIKDVSDKVISKYFKGRMASASKDSSCVYKHLLALESVVKENCDFALILEDDISFYPGFNERMKEIMAEAKTKQLKNFILSIEDSNLKYVAKSELTPGQIIYPKKKGRLAGAFIVDKAGAQSMLDYAQKVKVELPMDWYHNLCVEKGLVNMYWSKYSMAVQGSLDGTIASTLDDKKSGNFRVLSFKMQRVYKKLLYSFR